MGRPIVALIVPLVILVPLAAYSSGLARDFDLLGDLPKSEETRQGFEVLAEHFGPGLMQPLNVVAVDDARFDTPQGLENIKTLQTLLQGTTHVTKVRSFTGSLDDKTLSVAAQLEAQTQGSAGGHRTNCGRR